MIDEKEVLKALVCRANDPVVNCAGCPYRDPECEFICDYQRICLDTLALLKEREARVLDWNEIGTVDGAVWLEDRDENEVVPGLVMQMHSAVNLDIKKDGKLRTASASRSDYGDRWRAWSARPTEEQRKAVKWND
ncbi:MAG: hypothetical protein J6Y26_03200 [Lachnospiraceae bacterium]|nr:hypothetical protein [Lachnospiraceae bacterium]